MLILHSSGLAFRACINFVVYSIPVIPESLVSHFLFIQIVVVIMVGHIIGCLPCYIVFLFLNSIVLDS